jgi:hypothetical protein
VKPHAASYQLQGQSSQVYKNPFPR